LKREQLDAGNHFADRALHDGIFNALRLKVGGDLLNRPLGDWRAAQARLVLRRDFARRRARRHCRARCVAVAPTRNLPTATFLFFPRAVLFLLCKCSENKKKKKKKKPHLFKQFFFLLEVTLLFRFYSLVLMTLKKNEEEPDFFVNVLSLSQAMVLVL
jgi:hypothetical protein